MSNQDTFGARSTLEVGGESYEIYRLGALQQEYDVARLPYSLKILLENLLRHGEDEGARALASWDAKAEPSQEIAYTPARVLMQDFTGVPAIVDLAAMRDAMEELGGDATKINPLVPVELVIDHSIQVDVFAERLAFQRNAELEFERNKERYAFLRWGQTAFENFAVVPPNTGICHQVNLEYLARVVESRGGQAFPDTLVGTDSHTTMVNGLGVLGWGVGGIEAEAAMLGQPVSMLIPQVVGFRLSGELPEGSTATDLVLTVTQRLRERGVVGKFVEFYGPGLPNLPLADRATIGNMSPEMGATCAIFPVDRETLRYLEFSGRPPERVELVEAYSREQGLFHDEGSEDAAYSDTLELDLSEVEPSLAGPKRPQDRVALSDAAQDFRAELDQYVDGDVLTGYDEAAAESFPASDPPTNNGGGTEPKVGHSHPEPGTAVAERSEGFGHGSVVIAAITSCTNTSNPSVMLGAGLLAQKAVEAGLERMPWVKTSLAPGSKVVTDYLERAGPDRAALAPRLRPRRLRLHHLHRELGPAPRGDLQGDRGARPGGGERAVGQPQLRGPHPPRGEDELSRLAAAVRGLRAGRPHGPRHGQRAAPGRRLPARHLAHPAGGQRRDRVGHRVGHVPLELRRGVRGRRQLERARRSPRATATPGTTSRPTSSAALLRGHAGRGAGGLRADRGRAVDRRARRQRDHRPHLTGRRDQEGLARRART